MIRGSRVRCHRFFLTVSAVAVCVLTVMSAGAQTRSNFSSSVTSESMAAVWLARDRGLFKKHGLDTQFILMPRNPLAIAALLAGEIDVAVVAARQRRDHGPAHLGRDVAHAAVVPL